jgi:hypothetical protein
MLLLAAWPAPVVAWLANVIFIALPVAIVALTLQLMVNPARSVGEWLFESHKVVLVGGVALGGVALVEAVVLAAKLGMSSGEVTVYFLVGVMLLLVDVILGVGLFAGALAYGARQPAGFALDRSLVGQAMGGVFLLGCAICIAMQYKWLEFLLNEG